MHLERCCYILCLWEVGKSALFSKESMCLTPELLKYSFPRYFWFGGSIWMIPSIIPLLLFVLEKGVCRGGEGWYLLNILYVTDPLFSSLHHFAFYTHKMWWCSLFFRALLVTGDRNPTQNGLSQKGVYKSGSSDPKCKGRLAAGTGECRGPNTIITTQYCSPTLRSMQCRLAKFSNRLSNCIIKVAASSSRLISASHQSRQKVNPSFKTMMI